MVRTQPLEHISHKESDQLRAVAIVIILMHNFMHWLNGSPGENEYQFELYRSKGFLEQLEQMPWDFVRLLSTYYGHYAVQIFFFLSGYGIATRYGQHVPSWLGFTKRRLTALYIPIAFAVAGMFLYQILRGSSADWAQIKALGYQLTGISNFMPGNAVWAPVGPWWFIGVILHFYLLAPILLKAARRYGCWVYLVMIAIGLYLEVKLNQDLVDDYKWSINFCLLGHLDTIGLGMLATHFGKNLWKIVQSWWWTIAWLWLFIHASLSERLWEISGFACVLGALPALRWILAKLNKVSWIDTGIAGLGALSMFLFLCHGYLRKPFIDIANDHGGISWAFYCFGGFIVTALLWSAATRYLYQRLLRLCKISG